ncbi:galactose mutarotase [Balneolaceae bacterium YR4-1]|uniref:Aldose 1-epimerase n=1 Tax=Halalkalibaculum roseum TaxID=2709311 RepID=A0A6M1SZK3_9BACT|nr:aldose epimerase family protein [Halalkalibaculum roseum]NGP76624.1 galactose mutarotase [Halalkalibaculum roseum]
MARHLKVADFQAEIDGRETDLFFLENRNGVRAAITNYGARVVALWLPDADGVIENIVAGYESIDAYLNHDEAYLGAMVGRYANRIAKASFILNGEKYRLTANEGRHHLHGGKKGFHNSVWSAAQTRANTLNLKLELPDGNEGFPSNMKVDLQYTFTGEDELVIELKATTDKPTVLNITHHSYFNLGGESNGSTARNHRLKINADHYLPVSEEKIPLGPLQHVKDTPFDFRTDTEITEHIKPGNVQLEIAEGFDHNFVLNKIQGNELSFAARVQDPISGQVMELHTTEPGLQFFECEFPPEMELNLKTAFCLEPQHFPDSPNRSHFSSTILRPGEQFHSKSIYRFKNKN